MDLAVIIKEEWAAISGEFIALCWAKADVLGAMRTKDILLEHGENRRSFRAVADAVNEVLSIIRGTTLGDETLGGLRADAKRSVVWEWLDIEKQHEGVMSVADGCLQDATATPPISVDTDEE